MPTETIVVLAGVVAVFAIFAVALAWADVYTSKGRQPGAAE